MTETVKNPANNTHAFQQALENAIDGEAHFDRVYRSMYSTDASVYQILPAGVVIPRHREDVIETVRLCRAHGVSITARGGGTSQAGQAIGAGISLDFTPHMNRLLQLDLDASTVTVEPGLVLDELNAQLKPYGLQLPLDLSTSSRATIGGMIANNSAGTRSVLYGKTIDYVESLTVVLSDGSLVEMGPLDGEELADKLRQQDLEGEIYRTVHGLGHEHADEIERRYPKILRRVGGYNLDSFVPTTDSEDAEDAEEAPPFNLARMMVGSEGTLGLTAAARLRVVPLPKQRVLCSVQFDDLLDAMAATPVILAHAPSAIELMDRFMLDQTRGRIEFEPLRDFIEGDPGAVLLVEFMGEGVDELTARIDGLVADLAARGLGNHNYRALEAAAQNRIWTLRRAALGLTMSETGDAKAISFVEDTAVAPEHLRDYIENFRAILTKYDTQAGFYAHASVGLLHVRPVVNMKTAEGARRFEAIANEVADLVLEYGGSLSGEHGDGLVRAPFQERMFGPTLYRAFCQVKIAFDPHGLFNPGKIVQAPPLTDNLRFGADYVTPEIETVFDFSDFGGYLQAAEQCSGVGACRKTLTGTMCPSYMATRNENDSTRGRANALRQAITGQMNAGKLGQEEMLPVLDLCLECKACKSECPTGVDMARLKSEYLHQYHERHGATWQTRALSQVNRVAQWGSRLAPVSNWLLETGATRGVNERLFGLDRRRALPAFARHSFTRSFSKQQPRLSAPSATATVVLFADTFNNFYEPEHLSAAAQLVQKTGGEVAVAPYVCCGRPLISKGFLDAAAQQAAATTRTLLPLVERGLPVLFAEPSCYSAVRDDHPRLLRGAAQADAQRVADASLLFEEWPGLGAIAPQPLPQQVLLHGHCHQKALVGVDATVRLLSCIPDARVTSLDSGCCGMAGLFGYEHYDISQTIAEDRLLPAVRGMDADGVVVSPGFSCRQQIKHFAGVPVHSPMSLLVSLLD